ncbi:MAG: hypothetical protein OXH37_08100, partial [Gammaproteobacteria bacterium]|nr:hypothetical protein [Gammaproteobacteria bacterium]
MRLQYAAVLLAALAACSEAPRPDPYRAHLTALNPDWTVTEDEAYAWATVKNANLPTFTGSPEWQRYMAFLEAKLKEYGAVDLLRNRWTFERWDTTDDSTGWSLRSDVRSVRVANYGAYSGSTGSD